MKFSKKLLFIPVVIVAFFATLSAGKSDFDIGKNIQILLNTIKGVNIYYVDSIDNDKMIKRGIDAMLSQLDPYTQYISKEEMEGFNTMTTGKYGGVGSAIRLPYGSDYIVFDEITEGFPIYKSEIMSGDSILAVDGVDMKGAEAAKVSDAMKGAPDTKVVLTVKSIKDGSVVDHTLKRETVSISPISYSGMINDSIAYIGFTTFSEESGKLFRDEFSRLKREYKPKGLIVDLRSNGGGIIDESIDMVSAFVPKGTLVTSLKGRSGENHRDYYTSKEPIDTEIPLAVLINSSSASASEIVSGAIQDLDRGVIVGLRSVGKGLAQRPQDVGYGAMVKITVAKYYIPSGRCIQAVDYSHRSSDGSVSRVPDSLRNEFLTKSGRKVLDGGGIEPDVEIRPEYLDIFTASLAARGYLADYANLYAANNLGEIVVRDFKLSDEDYSKFVEFVVDKPIEFTSITENNLSKMEQSAKQEGYYDDIKESLTAIERVVKERNTKLHLEQEKELIKEMLALEIVSRYNYSRGRVEYAIMDDNQVDEAVSVLSDISKYSSILSPKAN